MGRESPCRLFERFDQVVRIKGNRQREEQCTHVAVNSQPFRCGGHFNFAENNQLYLALVAALPQQPQVKGTFLSV